MATRYATKSGNWSDTTVWDGGTLPAAGDSVYSNNFTVTVDQDIDVYTLSNINVASPVIANGGYFNVASSRSIHLAILGTDTYLAATSNNKILLVTLASGRTVSISVDGTISSRTTGTTTYPIQLAGSSGILNVTAASLRGLGSYGVIAGPGNNMVINITAPLLEVVSGGGVIVGGVNGIAGTGVIINFLGCPILRGSGISGVTSGGEVTFNFPQGARLARTHGSNIYDSFIRTEQNTSTVTINVSAVLYVETTLAPTGTGSYPITLAGGNQASPSNTRVTIRGVVRGWASTVSTEYTYPVVQNVYTPYLVRISGELVASGVDHPDLPAASGGIGSFPVWGDFSAIAGEDLSYLLTTEIPSWPGSPTPASVLLTRYGTDLPAIEDVRSGLNYGPTGILEGTLAVPDPASVAYGVPVDDAMGTASLDLATIAAVVGAQVAAAVSVEAED